MEHAVGLSPRKQEHAVVEAPAWKLEQQLWQRGYGCVAGVDEAGRGALAGPVVAALVVLPFARFPFRDSKLLTRTERELLAPQVKETALCWAIGAAWPEEVDRINVLAATLLAVERALAVLDHAPDALVTDYLKPRFSGPVLPAAKGESLSLQIAAASILAKTERDAFMRRLDADYPGYGFGGHKGYSVPGHLRALSELGPCPAHRRSFRPVDARATVLTAS